MSTKFNNLYKEVATGQEETAQLVAKKLKKAPEYQSRRKRNEKQFQFNDSVSDTIQSASGTLKKIKPTAPQEATLLQKAKEHLLEGTKAIEEHQKPIRIADRSDLGWPVAEAYQQVDELAAVDIKCKRLDDAVKLVEQQQSKRKRENDHPRKPSWRSSRVHHAGPPQPIHFAGSGLPMGRLRGPSVPMGQFEGPPLPVSIIGGPAPPMFYSQAPQPPLFIRPSGPRPRTPGPCFNCTDGPFEGPLRTQDG